jgi:hypothetical protein
VPLSDKFTTLLLRGLLAGVVAGILTGGVAFVIGEPQVEAAIAIEEAAASPATGEEEPIVSRDLQKLGLILATSLAGISIGAIFAVVVHYARQSSRLRGSTLAIAVALCGWLAVAVVPFFKYPANPPAVGNPETIDQRTLLWFGAVGLGLVAVGAAIAAHGAVRSHPYLSMRVAAPLVAFIVVVTIGYLVLPTVNEVGDDFPAVLLWQFRIASLVTQATLWIGLGLVFAFLTERAASKTSIPGEAPAF